MISTNRKFHFVGELIIKKSRVLAENDSLPVEDTVNWLFILINGIDYSFVYKIVDPGNAQYNMPFLIEMSLTRFDLLHDVVKLDGVYTIKRGEEEIGNVKILRSIDE
ncbi:hypothetical protein CMT76_11155 [Elizabethkingia anophelis]|uniref:hypothetical protein n=1 Tax=Elizabethkingia TaxID=308865 RepID=UPI000750F26D|nr:hypothetical protein [Elizabethkingia ursingii]MCT4185166.1 hypothetical protein [Elizabethkingia anophelis]KUY30679.1 hypothetical protein ATB96_12305 [Elizabethkingia ursingii]MCT4274275.1 hypothetical protein [Elizabethkingia anophelis]MCT4291844.1 hypothetical protein [Elizabethkingia anophelis]MDV3931277.1 hypothetical protein [Elizabethkingia anophelis]